MSVKTELFRDLSRRASSAPLSELLPGVIRLAKSLGEDDILRWARLEFDGYITHDEPTEEDKAVAIPPYRFITGQFSDEWGRPIRFKDPNLSFVNQYPLRSGVAVLEQMASRPKEIYLRDEISAELFREHFGVEVGTFSFSPMVVAGILSGIRERLIESLDAIEAKHPALSPFEGPGATSDETSLPEKWLRKLKNHRVVAAVVFLGVVLVAVESTTTAISSLFGQLKELRRAFSADTSDPTSGPTPIEDISALCRSIKITYPLSRQQTPVAFLVTGTVAGEPKDYKYWIFTTDRAGAPSKYWPQKPLALRQDGTWGGQVDNIGDGPPGTLRSFGIFLVGPKGNAAIEKWRQRADRTMAMTHLTADTYKCVEEVVIVASASP